MDIVVQGIFHECVTGVAPCVACYSSPFVYMIMFAQPLGGNFSVVHFLTISTYLYDFIKNVCKTILLRNGNRSAISKLHDGATPRNMTMILSSTKLRILMGTKQINEKKSEVERTRTG